MMAAIPGYALATSTTRTRSIGARALFFRVLCASLLYAPAALAQVVRGQVITAEDGRPLQGVLLVLINGAGNQLAASLSDMEGRFRIQAPEPGTFRVRGELVGRPIDLSDPFELAAGDEKTIRIVSFSRPQVLQPVQITGASTCPASPDAERVASLWVEVTKALRISEWTVSDDRLVFDIETVRRDWDARHRRIESEMRSIHEGMKGRPFTTVPPDFLAANGYVVVRGFDNLYFAPDAKSLLHESFLTQHCLSLAKPRPGLESLIGIAFARAPDRLRPDINGVFWLHADSLLLRAVDYRYSGLPEFDMHPSLGGRMEFDRLSSGEWYISRWSINMPVVSLCRATGFLGLLSSRTVSCLDGIVEAAGEVLDVRRQIAGGR